MYGSNRWSSRDFNTDMKTQKDRLKIEHNIVEL